MVQIAHGIAQTFRADAEVSFGSSSPTLLNNKELASSAAKYAKELLSNDRAFAAEEFDAAYFKSAGSKDFAYVSQEVPSIMLALAAGQPQKKGYSYPQHHPMVKFDESALAVGCAVYAYTAMRWLEDRQ